MILIFLIIVVIAAILGIVLFLVLVFPGKANKNVPFANINMPYTLSPIASNFIQSVKYDAANRTVEIRKKDSASSMVITLITRSGGKVSSDVYTLNFGDGNTVTIPCDAGEYYIVLEKANGRNVKDTQRSSNGLMGTIIFSAVSGLLLSGGCVLYTSYCAGFLDDYYPEYATYYITSFLPLLIVPLSIALFILIDKMVIKGGK